MDEEARMRELEQRLIRGFIAAGQSYSVCATVGMVPALFIIPIDTRVFFATSAAMIFVDLIWTWRAELTETAQTEWRAVADRAALQKDYRPKQVSYTCSLNDRNLSILDDNVLELVMSFVGTEVKSARCSCKRLCGQVQSLKVHKDWFLHFAVCLLVKYPHIKCLDLSNAQRVYFKQFGNVLSTCSLLHTLNLSGIAADRHLLKIGQHCKEHRDHLRNIDLTDCQQITNMGLACLGYCPLEKLNIAECQNLSNRGLGAILSSRGPHIKSIVLRNCAWVNDSSLTLLHVCAELQALDLTGTPAYDVLRRRVTGDHTQPTAL